VCLSKFSSPGENVINIAQWKELHTETLHFYCIAEKKEAGHVEVSLKC
jgi:hypothetical protein